MGYVILLWHSLSLPYNYFSVEYEKSFFTTAHKIGCGMYTYLLVPPKCVNVFLMGRDVLIFVCVFFAFLCLFLCVLFTEIV